MYQGSSVESRIYKTMQLYTCMYMYMVYMCIYVYRYLFTCIYIPEMCKMAYSFSSKQHNTHLICMKHQLFRKLDRFSKFQTMLQTTNLHFIH